MLIRNVEPSPDGQWIAFSTEGRQEDIFVVRSDGSELRQLTNDIDRDRGVSWTPDGARIIFYSTRAGGYDAWGVRTDGSELKQLTKGFQVNFPIVSPDGKRLYLFDLADARIAKLDGGAVATETETLPRLPGGDGFFANGWSPDGSRLVGTGWSQRADLFVYTPADKTYKVVVSDVFGASKSDDLFEGASLRVSVKWIDDRRVIMSTAHNNLTVVDVTTKQVRVVAPVSDVVASRNGRTLLAGGRQSEADIWMLKLKE
jgi:Tol biopolymer transport system component